MQIAEVYLHILPVGLPRDPVHSRCGLRANRPVGRPQTSEVNVVQQRREPCFLILSCYLTHTIQRMGHT